MLLPGKNKTVFNLKNPAIALFIAVAFCLLGFFSVKDYGFTMDSHNYFYRGEAYLNFFLTGAKRFSKQQRNCRFQDEDINPFNYDLLSKEMTDKKKNLFAKTGEGSYGGFTGTVSALGCEIFYKRLNLLGDLDAHHYAYVLLASIAFFFYFLFVSQAFNRVTAFWATAFLFLFPRFMGHVPNNPKDSVVACLGIIAIYFFWLAMSKKEWKYLMPTAMLISFAVTTKTSGYMIPCILFLWAIGYFIRYKKFSLRFDKSFWVYMFLSFFVFILVVYIFSPSWWVDPLGIYRSIAGLTKYATNNPVGWTSDFTQEAAFDIKKKIIYAFFPMGLVFITTPVFTLALGVSGFFVALGRIKENFRTNQIDNYLLVVLWFIIPIIIASLPGPSYYVRVPRHFMLFMPALCILAGLGGNWATKYLRTKWSRLMDVRVANFLIGTLIFFGLGSIAISIVNIHPYETTFFNRLIGGLSGARKVKLPGRSVGIPDASDFWCNSYRSGTEWLNKNALPNSYLVVTYGERVVVYAKELRKDITIIKEDDFNFEQLNKGPFYVMIIPTYWEELYDGLLQYCYKNAKPLYSISSQGAPILLIYKL